MENNSNNAFVKKISWLIILIAIFGIGFYSGAHSKKSDQGPTTEIVKESVSLMLDYGNGTVKVYSGLPFVAGNSVFDLLQALELAQKIKLDYKDYGGDLGVFLNSIDGIGKDAKDQKYWQYWLNNEYSTVGVSTYALRPGDVIEFKFIKGQTVSE
jgi:hypothetical protein